jgi:spoIIIJ-associated protein
MSEYQEFTGKSVEEALKLAREAFGAELNDLDFEILTPGSRGVLGMGAEPARIVAAPRAALGGAAPKREAAAAAAARAPPRTTPATTARRAATTGPATIDPRATGRHRRTGPRRVTARRVVTTDPERTDRVVTARPVATTDLGETIARRPRAADRPTCPPPRPPKSRPRAVRWPLNEPTLKRPRPRPRRSRPARRSSSS